MKNENAIRWGVIIFLIALFVIIGFYASRTHASDNYKQKYRALLKKYERLQKDYQKLGNENESTYQDYLQCERELTGKWQAVDDF